MLRRLPALFDVRIGIGYLFALALVPGGLAGPILLYDFYQSQRAQLEQEALQTARTLSQAVDHDLSGMMGKLQTLATSPSLRAGDLRG